MTSVTWHSIYRTLLVSLIQNTLVGVLFVTNKIYNIKISTTISILVCRTVYFFCKLFFTTYKIFTRQLPVISSFVLFLSVHIHAHSTKTWHWMPLIYFPSNFQTWDNLNDSIFKSKYVLKICNRSTTPGATSLLIIARLPNLISK